MWRTTDAGTGVGRKRRTDLRLRIASSTCIGRALDWSGAGRTAPALDGAAPDRLIWEDESYQTAVRLDANGGDRRGVESERIHPALRRGGPRHTVASRRCRPRVADAARVRVLRLPLL